MAISTKRRQVCGVVVLRDDGAALLQLRDDRPDIQDPAMWVFPGGHVEENESLEAGARRELREETDYQCGEVCPVAAYLGEEIGYRSDFQISFFWCPFDARQKVVCREGQRLNFVLRSELDSLPAPHYLGQVWDLALAASGIAPGAVTELEL